MKTRRNYKLNQNHTIKIKKRFKTLKAHRNGLMFVKTPLPENTGALFVYPKKRILHWMKHTYIPLDVIALNDKRRVIGMVHNMRPKSLQLHTVPNNTAFAIEINAGYIKRNNIELGDHVMFSK